MNAPLKVFVIVSHSTGLRSIDVFPHYDDEAIDAAEAKALEAGYTVEQIAGLDLRDVVLSHPSLFEEGA